MQPQVKAVASMHTFLILILWFLLRNFASSFCLFEPQMFMKMSKSLTWNYDGKLHESE